MTLPTIRFDIKPAADGDMYSAYPLGNKPFTVGAQVESKWSMSGKATAESSFFWGLDRIDDTNGPKPEDLTILTRQIAVQPIGTRLFEGVASTDAVTTSVKISCPGEFDGLRLAFRNHMENHADMTFSVASTDTVDREYSAAEWNAATWNDGESSAYASGDNDASWYKPELVVSDPIPMDSMTRAGDQNRHVLIRGYPNEIRGGWFSYPKPQIAPAAYVTPANRGIVYQIGRAAGNQTAGGGVFSDSTTSLSIGAIFNTLNPGLSVMGIGDSLMQCDGVSYSDRYSSYGLRACADASTDALPVGWWNAGGSAMTSSFYMSSGLSLADTVKPNVMIYQAWSPNDLWNINADSSVASIQALADAMAERVTTVRDYCEANEITLILCTGTPLSKLNTAAKDYVRTSFNDLLRVGVGYYLLDLASIVGDGATPEGFLPEYGIPVYGGTGDGTHYNEAALDAIATRLSAILRLCAASSYYPTESVPDAVYEGRTHTVTATATGGGDGTDENPWTLQEACQKAVAGNIIGMGPGVYVGTKPLNDYGQVIPLEDAATRLYPAFNPANSGTATKPIIFVAQYPAATTDGPYTDIRSGGTLIYESGTGSTRWKYRGWPALGSYKRDYITWIGPLLDIRNDNNKTWNDSSPANFRTGTGCGIKKAWIIGEKGQAWGGDNQSGVRLENQTDPFIIDCEIEQFWWLEYARDTGVLTYSCHNFNIQNNYMHDCASAVYVKGIRMDSTKLWGNYGSINNNYFANNNNNGFPNWGYVPEYIPNYQNIKSEYKNNVHFMHNIHMYFTSEGGFYDGGSYTYQNHLRIENNTYYTTKTNAGNQPRICWNIWSPWSNEFGDSTFKNNIVSNPNGSFIGNSYQELSGLTAALPTWAEYDFNFYQVRADKPFGNNGTVGTWKWPEWQGFGNDLNSVTSGDPMFVNAAAGDLRLKPESPARQSSPTGGEVGAYADGALVGVRK